VREFHRFFDAFLEFVARHTVIQDNQRDDSSSYRSFGNPFNCRAGSAMRFPLRAIRYVRKRTGQKLREQARGGVCPAASMSFDVNGAHQPAAVLSARSRLIEQAVQAGLGATRLEFASEGVRFTLDVAL
jgi:hypothetical protein